MTESRRIDPQQSAPTGAPISDAEAESPARPMETDARALAGLHGDEPARSIAERWEDAERPVDVIVAPERPVTDWIDEE